MNIPLYRAAVDEIHVDDALIQKTLARLQEKQHTPLRRWVPALACACLVLCMIGGVGLRSISQKKTDSMLPEDVEMLPAPQEKADDTVEPKNAGGEISQECDGAAETTNAFFEPSVSAASLPALEYQGKCYSAEEAIALLQDGSDAVPRELLVKYLQEIVLVLREQKSVPEETLIELEKLWKGEAEE